MSKTPKLRFKEFCGEWEEKKLGETVTLMQSGLSRKLSDSDIGIPVIRSNNLIDGKVDSCNIKYWYAVDNQGANLDNYFLKNGDLLINFINSLAQIGKAGIYNNNLKRDCIFTTNIMRLNFNSDIDVDYIFNYFQLKKYNDYIQSIAKPAVNQASFTTVDFKKFEINIPSLKEQQKIAQFLSLIDKKIQKQQQKVEGLKDYKKGMMQKIFSQEIRFKGDNVEEYPEWNEGIIENIVFPDLYPIKKPDTAYWRLGIRSHGKGTFHEYVTDPREVNMDTLYEVKKHTLIVNITFAWEHAIAITDEKDEGKLVSHRFPTYSFNDNAYFKFYKYYLLRPIFKYQLANASPGGAGRNRVLNKNQFLDIPVLIPSLEEQKQIAEFLTKLDQKLDKEQEKLDSLNQWKKGLLQQMFV